MTRSFDTRIPLHDGHGIPQLGFGLYKVPDADAPGVVEVAIAAGYRHLDDAKLYENERGVGDGIRASGIDRDELFVTTKVWNADHGFDRTLAAFDASLERLGLDEVDLYLIHWPAPHQDLYVETWRALIRLREEGRARSIGVSNFHVHHLERVIDETGVVPVVNQVELHPWLQQRELRAFHAEHGIVTEAWSPLARGRAIGDETLASIGTRYGKNEAQVAIRWHLQVGNVTIPKSVTPERIRANTQVFDFELDADDLAAIDALDADFRTGRDPDDLD
ncbi:aldo/keto reductase [Glaciibacter flavus]|uniref:Aldo/keto reductase n=1 Tax=Orlajensenia flava TaxID=2565934 RepID=A0A4S4FZM8_9MICO|nr:aldo/keto reductase [Glaciibacter flavus]THG36104.1 aldo/keto reductase [Glaciibacter flavus]